MPLQILETLNLYKPLDYNHRRFDHLARLLESPIEKIFWSAGYFELSKHGKLTPQVDIGHYRVDFLYLVNGKKIAIELDGHDYHCQKDQMTNDYKRQRFLQRQGIEVIRFTGQEIYGDIQNCIKEILNSINY